MEEGEDQDVIVHLEDPLSPIDFGVRPKPNLEDEIENDSPLCRYQRSRQHQIGLPTCSTSKAPSLSPHESHIGDRLTSKRARG